jgi:hypothetical protein
MDRDKDKDKDKDKDTDTDMGLELDYLSHIMHSASSNGSIYKLVAPFPDENYDMQI